MSKREAAPVTDVRKNVSDAFVSEVKSIRRNPRVDSVHVMSQAPGNVTLDVQAANPEMLGITSGDSTVTVTLKVTRSGMSELHVSADNGNLELVFGLEEGNIVSESEGAVTPNGQFEALTKQFAYIIASVQRKLQRQLSTAMSNKKLANIIATLDSMVRKADVPEGVNMGDGLLYFGIQFADYQYDEDKSAENDPEAEERIQAFHAMKDPEMHFAAELGAMFSKALGRQVRVMNEGHNNYELVCKIGINSEDELAKAIDAIQRRDTTTNDGILVTDSMNGAPYVSAQGFSYTPVDKMGQMSIDWSDLIDWVDEYEQKSR